MPIVDSYPILKCWHGNGWCSIAKRNEKKGKDYASYDGESSRSIKLDFANLKHYEL